MTVRKPLSAALPPDAAAFVRGEAPVAPPAPAAEATVRFTVDLPRSMHKQLKLAALNQDAPMSDLVRQILSEWLGSYGA